MATRKINGVRNNSDGTTSTVEYAIGNDNSNQVAASGTLTSSNTSVEIDWGISEGIFICSGTFTGATAAGAAIALQQYIGSEWVTFNNGQKKQAGGFQFITCAPKVRVNLTNSDATTSVFFKIASL